MGTLAAVLTRKRHEKARQRAFADLHREHAVGVYNLAYRLVGDREDARDITQEVLLKAYEQLSHESELNERAWLYRVTVNACYDHHRRVKRRPSIACDLEFEPACGVDSYEQSELRQQLGSALHRLPPVQRTALILREVHGLRTEEVAEILGVQADSAAVTLSRARSSFRRHYLEQTGEVAGGRQRRLAGAGACGAAALAGLHLPSLSLPMLPLPSGLDVGSVLAAAGSVAGGAAAVAAASGGGAAAGALSGISALLSTKVATVAASATLAAGTLGGAYAAVERQHVPAPAPPAPAALAAPAARQTAAAVPDGAVATAAQGAAAATQAPEPLTLGESSEEPAASPSAAVPTEEVSSETAVPSEGGATPDTAATPGGPVSATASVLPTAMPTSASPVPGLVTAIASPIPYPSATPQPSPWSPVPFASPTCGVFPAPSGSSTPSPLPAPDPSLSTTPPTLYMVP